MSTSATAPGRLRLYLAGPDVFVPDPVTRGATLKALCTRHGAIGLFPMDNDTALDSVMDLPSAIRSANMDLIRTCHAVVANMSPFRGPSMDPGTAYEMGAAAALGKPVVGYTSDPRSYVERVSRFMPVARDDGYVLRDADGMAVEEFDVPLADNLMMARGIDRLFTSAEEAIAYIVGVIACS